MKKSSASGVDGSRKSGGWPDAAGPSEAGRESMSIDHYPRGVLVPAVTPFQRDLSVDAKRFVDHCRWLLAEGASGLAVFGTTSEANALSVAERMDLLEGLIDDGLYASIAEVVERVADMRLRIYLYHIPPMAGVGFSLQLIERLLKSYRGVVTGIKDSSGDWKYTQALLG